METPGSDPIDLLRDALAEAQTTVRAYDTKAQIVGVGYIFALGIVGGIGSRLAESSIFDVVALLLFWGVVVFPILLFGFVLHPTRRTAPLLSRKADESDDRLLYVKPHSYEAIAELRAAAIQADPIDEYCYELLKMSQLRELKRKRFVRGLIAAAVAFLLLFLDQIARV